MYLLNTNSVMPLHLVIPKSRSELKLDFHHGLLSPNSDFLAMSIKESQVCLWQQNVNRELLVPCFDHLVAFHVY